MRTALTLFSIFICLSTFSQTLTGKFVESKTLEPVETGTLIIVGTAAGCTLNSQGHFSINTGGHSVIQFSSILYPRHEIRNLPADTNAVIDLGTIHIIDGGITAYVMKSKKRGKRAKCEQVDTRKEIKDEDLEVPCLNGETTFKWEFDKPENLFFVDYEKIKNCIQHPLK